MRFARDRLAILSAASLLLGCGDGGGDATNTLRDAAARRTHPVYEAHPLHLEELVALADVRGAELPEDLVEPREWRFAEGAQGWRALPALVPDARPARVEPTADGLRITLPEGATSPEEADGRLYGGIYVEVPEWDTRRWSEILVEARADASIRFIGAGYSVRRAAGRGEDETWPLAHFADGTVPIADGRVRTYRLDAFPEDGPPAGPVRELGIEVGSDEPASVEIVSVTWIPRDALYAEAGLGVRSVTTGGEADFGPRRRAIFAHAPARLAYPLPVPAGGRLDLGMASEGAGVRFTVSVVLGGREERLLEESVQPGEAWRQRSVDLATVAGEEVELVLAAEPAADEGERNGSPVALWSAPTVSGTTLPGRPNVVLYVIDGASAAYMSLYGYDRETTPNLERLAEEGVVFERAHSNSTWTTPSTASFMTSLHHSVLGGYGGERNPVPESAVTLAEHFHRAGFQTGVFTTNPNAGSLSGLDRAVDAFRDHHGRGKEPSSVQLHREFWRWREAYPGSPYWVHFQSTDVHPPYHPPPPFAGRYASEEQRELFESAVRRIPFPSNHDSASVHEYYHGELERLGLPARDLYRAMHDVHDEALAHQDHQIGRLVTRLKENGEWDRTLFVVASDHGHPAASWPRFGRGLLDPQPEPWEGALFGEHNTHIPLLFVWPGEIEGGRRIADPVSMIDLLPTLLDLAGLPPPELAQGRSLAPLLRGEVESDPRPVLFDEFRLLRDGGELIGNFEVLDGRWGASLELATADAEPLPTGRHPAPAGGRWPAKSFPDVPRLLLYDLEEDPLALRHANDRHPDRVAEARRRLQALWETQRALAERFDRTGDVQGLTNEQLEGLRSLGYTE